MAAIGKIMQLQHARNGNLIFIAESSDETMIDDLLDRHEGNDLGFLRDLLDLTGWSGNGVLRAVRPIDIGALTDAPIVTDGFPTDTTGGTIWWYPNYMVRHLGEELKRHKQVIFQSHR